MNGNIGTSKSKEMNSRLFTYHKIDHKVEDIGSNIEKIHSTIISKDIFSIDLEECNFWIKDREKVYYELFIIVDIEYKIVYSLKNDTMLYAINHSNSEFVKVRIPIEVDKSSIEDFISKGKVNDNIYIEDLKLEINESFIAINGYMIVILKELEKEEILLQIVSDSGDNNLFLTNSMGNYLDQKTFNLNNNYISISFLEQKILYILKGESSTGLYEFRRDLDIEENIEPIGMNLCWTSVIPISENNLLATYFNSKICNLSNGTGFSLCFIRDNKILNIDNNIVVSEKNLPKLSKDKSAFIYVKNENYMDKVYIYNILTEKNRCLLGSKKILQIQVSKDGSYVLLLVMGKKGRSIFIANTINSNIKEILVPIRECKIKDIYFFDCNCILIVIHNNLRDDLYIYNISKDYFEKLTNNEKGRLISSVMICNIEKAIILSIKDNDGYNLYKYEVYSKRLIKLLDINARGIEIISKA